MVCKWLLLVFLSLALDTATTTSASCDLLQVKYGSAGNYVVCRGEFLPVENLKTTLQNFKENINIFELRNASLDVLPEDMFSDVKNAEIQKIIFSKSNVELLSLPEMQYSAFKSVEDTLESLEVYDSLSVFAWNISVLASLKKLKTLIIEDSELFEVKVISGNLPNLRLIQFINSGIRWMHSHAFKNINKLTICSLTNNHITEIKRSMFPWPATYLWNLDLSFNRLIALPTDMFVDMPSLHELKLDNNHLKYFKVELIKPMWNRLTQLWMDGNNALCWPFCWSVGKEHRPLFLDSSKCRIGKSITLDKFYSHCGTYRKHSSRN